MKIKIFNREICVCALLNTNSLCAKSGAEMGISMEKTGMNTACTKGCADCARHKHRSESEYRALMNRLSRIEGQLRGIRQMVEDERYCVDILTQVSAVQSALNAFSRELLTSHIKSCVTEDIKRGHAEAVDELCATLQKLMK